MCVYVCSKKRDLVLKSITVEFKKKKGEETCIYYIRSFYFSFQQGTFFKKKSVSIDTALCSSVHVYIFLIGNQRKQQEQQYELL